MQDKNWEKIKSINENLTNLAVEIEEILNNNGFYKSENVIVQIIEAINEDLFCD